MIKKGIRLRFNREYVWKLEETSMLMNAVFITGITDRSLIGY